MRRRFISDEQKEKWCKSLLTEYKDLIWNISWKFHKKFGVDVEELYLESIAIIVERLERYDYYRASMSNYITTVLSLRLINFCKKHPTHVEYDPEVHYGVQPVTPLDELEIKERMLCMNYDAKRIRELALQQNGKSVNKIKRVLVQEGWQSERIYKGVEGMRAQVNNRMARKPPKNCSPAELIQLA